MYGRPKKEMSQNQKASCHVKTASITGSIISKSSYKKPNKRIKSNEMPRNENNYSTNPDYLKTVVTQSKDSGNTGNISKKANYTTNPNRPNQLELSTLEKLTNRPNFPTFLYQHEHELENKRMTIEMVKIMLKSDPSYNNNVHTIVKELNLDPCIIAHPEKIIQEVDAEDKSFKEDVAKEEEEKDVSSDDKMKYLYLLVTPKILTIKYKREKVQVIFKIVPSNVCYTAGVEFYDLKMDSIDKGKLSLTIELLKIDRCFIAKDKAFTINLVKDEFFYKKKQSLKVYTSSQEDTLNYALALNYLAQLVKCKVYNKFYCKDKI